MFIPQIENLPPRNDFLLHTGVTDQNGLGLKTSLKKAIRESKLRKGFRCYGCEKIFKEKTEWLLHVKSEHENKKQSYDAGFSWTHEKFGDYLSKNDTFSELTESTIEQDKKVISVSIKNKSSTDKIAEESSQNECINKENLTEVQKTENSANVSMKNVNITEENNTENLEDLSVENKNEIEKNSTEKFENVNSADEIESEDENMSDASENLEEKLAVSKDTKAVNTLFSSLTNKNKMKFLLEYGLPKGLAAFKCRACSVGEFRTKEAIDKHLATVHEGKKTVMIKGDEIRCTWFLKCLRCLAQFTSLPSMYEHIATAHEFILEKISMEGKQFKVENF